jgi:hypothetical protein
LNVLSFLWPHREGRLDVISSWMYGSGGGRAWRNFFDSMHLEKTYILNLHLLPIYLPVCYSLLGVHMFFIDEIRYCKI